MSNHIINSVGSASFSYPTKIIKNDTLRFNVTNTNDSTRYTGTIIQYTFPVKCKVKIEAMGARGSYGNLYTYGITEKSRSGNGAYCYGTFLFEKGDQLLILVGQHGKDAMTGTSSTKDQTTGGGGGGTFIVKKVASSSYQMIGTSINGSNIYNGWYVEPLIVAAGGNGSRDNGYSGTGTIYDGLGYTSGTAEAVGYNSTSSSYMVGGAFSKEVGSNSSASSSYRYGRCFLQGGLASMYLYKRTTNAGGGFGGGAANTDDGAGGGGGGWVSGYKFASAKSFINESFATNIGSTAGANNGDGYVVFTIIETYDYPTIYASTGSNLVISSKEAYVYVDATNKYKRIKELYAHNGSSFVKST